MTKNKICAKKFSSVRVEVVHEIKHLTSTCIILLGNIFVLRLIARNNAGGNGGETIRSFPRLDGQPESVSPGDVKHAFLKLQRSDRSRRELDVAFGENVREQHFHFRQRESVADAHPRPKTERHVRARIGDRLVTVEFIRVEFQRILVVFRVLVDPSHGYPDAHPYLDGERFVAGFRAGGSSKSLTHILSINVAIGWSRKVSLITASRYFISCIAS